MHRVMHIYLCMNAEGKNVKGGFAIKARALKAAIERFKEVVPKKAAKEYLTHLFLRQTGGRLELHGGDGEIYATLVIDVEPMGGNDVRVAVQYKQLTDFLKGLPENVMLKCMQTEGKDGALNLLAESKYGRHTFRGTEFVDFQIEPEGDDYRVVAIKVADFRDIVASTAFAADDSFFLNLHGIYFHFLPDKTNLVATNRYILSLYERADLVFSGVKSVIVPVKALHGFVAGIKDAPDNDEVSMYVSEHCVLFSYGAFRLRTPVINSSFPDYQSVIPTDTPRVAIFELEKLRKAVKRMATVANKKVPRIEFTFSGDIVELYTHNALNGVTGTENVACKYGGDTLKIAFSAKLLLPVLENIKGERIVMRMVGPHRSVVIEPETQTSPLNMLCLMMPLVESA